MKRVSIEVDLELLRAVSKKAKQLEHEILGRRAAHEALLAEVHELRQTLHSIARQHGFALQFDPDDLTPVDPRPRSDATVNRLVASLEEIDEKEKDLERLLIAATKSR